MTRPILSTAMVLIIIGSQAVSQEEQAGDYGPVAEVVKTTTSPRIVPRCYWLGATWPHEEKCMQQMISDLVAHGGRIYTNSTMSENGCYAGIHGTDGTWLGKLSTKRGFKGFWNEGGYAVAVSDKYVYLAAKILDWDAKANKAVALITIRRFLHDGSPAPFAGGVGDGADLVLHSTGTQEGWDAGWPHAVDDFLKVRGLAVYQGELFVANPVDNEIQAFDCETMRKKEGRSFAFENPGQITVDRDDHLWILTMPNGSIRKYTRGEGDTPGKFTGIEIRDVKAASDICVDNEGRLLVTDNGVDRQQIRFYDTQGKFLKSFGEPTYAKPDPGVIKPNRFYGIATVDVDDQGNIYVATNSIIANAYVDQAHGRQGRGTEIRGYDKDFNLKWTVHSLEWVDSVDADPAKPTDVYGGENRYVVDYSLSGKAGLDHPSWTVASYTVDPLTYPDDPRLHTYPHSVVTLRLQGRKIMYLQSERNVFTLYRFDGEIAVPAVILFGDVHQYRGRNKIDSSWGGFMNCWPQVVPDGYSSVLWVDRNGDGNIQKDEYQKLPTGSLDDVSVDSAGTIWIMNEHPKTSVPIHRIPLDGFSEAGVPLYDASKAQSAPFPEADLKVGRQLLVFPATDTAYFADWPEVRRYDGWSRLFDVDPATNPKRAWTVTVPFSQAKTGHHGRHDKNIPRTILVEGEYLFVTYDFRSEPEPDVGYENSHKGVPDVRVYRIKDGSLVGILEPGPEVEHQNAPLDQRYPVQTHLLNDGTYVIFIEDGVVGKILYYQWKP